MQPSWRASNFANALGASSRERRWLTTWLGLAAPRMDNEKHEIWFERDFWDMRHKTEQQAGDHQLDTVP
jgi:hypothetical protein